MNNEQNTALQQSYVGECPLPEAQEIALLAEVAKCSKCKVNDAQELHTCPYSEEIRGDSEKLCNCCADCEDECRMDI